MASKSFDVYIRYGIFFFKYIITFGFLFFPSLELSGYVTVLLLQIMFGVSLANDFFFSSGEEWNKDGPSKSLFLFGLEIPLMFIIFTAFLLQFVAIVFISIVVYIFTMKSGKDVTTLTFKDGDISKYIPKRIRNNLDSSRALLISTHVLLWILIVYTLFMTGWSPETLPFPINGFYITISAVIIILLGFLVNTTSNMGKYIHGITNG